MSEKKTSLLSRVEFLLIAVFFIAFLLWAVSKCSNTRRQYNQEAAQELEDSLAYEENTKALEAPKQDTVKPAAPPPTPKERYTPLYVTVESVNVRATPDLKGKLVDRLPLYEEVEFMNETTDSLYEINLGKITPKAPWVKIKTRKGRTGWVYGPCVSYYKAKLEGVE